MAAAAGRRELADHLRHELHHLLERALDAAPRGEQRLGGGARDWPRGLPIYHASELLQQATPAVGKRRAVQRQLTLLTQRCEEHGGGAQLGAGRGGGAQLARER